MKYDYATHRYQTAIIFVSEKTGLNDIIHLYCKVNQSASVLWENLEKKNALWVHMWPIVPTRCSNKSNISHKAVEYTVQQVNKYFLLKHSTVKKQETSVAMITETAYESEKSAETMEIAIKYCTSTCL